MPRSGGAGIEAENRAVKNEQIWAPRGAREPRRGWESAGEFVDAAVSGAKARRPALDRMMAAAGRRDFEAVLVYKIDRFGRSVQGHTRSR